GRHLIYPDNLDIKAGSFREAFDLTQDQLMVYLATPFFQLSGHNAQPARPFSTLNEAAPVNSHLSYQVQDEPDLAPDLLGQGPPGRVETLKYQARLVFGDISKESSVYLTPLARLIREAEKIRLDPNYGPPALYLYPDHPARSRLTDSLALLLARINQLEEYRLDPVQWRQADLDGPGQALVALLGVVGRNLPNLTILEQSPVLRPFEVYAALAKLAGELAVFAAPGLSVESLFRPPKYDHDDPVASLETLKTAIARLLESVAIGPEVSLVFERAFDSFPSGDLFSLALPQDLGEGPFWLAIRAAPTDLALVSRLARLGPPERLELLAAHSLPGIALGQASSAPPGLPKRPDLGYFQIRQSDPLWAEALKGQKLALLWPQAPETTMVRLTSGRRA
ncbi:MAG: type VI secretion system baseplate subunit TssK, partial [Deltaproteobacteria bacterium]|nr:type VI secretion system baseplate subunit TssK [Deltaproteobacteria bacterium]